MKRQGLSPAITPLGQPIPLAEGEREGNRCSSSRKRKPPACDRGEGGRNLRLVELGGKKKGEGAQGRRKYVALYGPMLKYQV